MRVALVLVGLAACSSGWLVPTEPMPVTWRHVPHSRHGYYEKGGVELDGWTCGEQYQRAVAGVPEAVAEMESCSHYNTAYGLLMSGFVLGVATSFGAWLSPLDPSVKRDVAYGGFVTGLTSFLVGYALVPFEIDHMKRAIRIYDQRVGPGP
jgi:hypothetical protein